MGKIEKALSSARKQREDRRGSPRQTNRQGESDSTSIESYYLPAIIDFEPTQRHELQSSVLEKNRIIRPGFSDAALTSYQMLRTRVLQQLGDSNLRTLAITAPHSGAGKTVIAINLAIAMASQSQRPIYLFDMDLRHPGIAACLGLPPNLVGLENYLSADGAMNEVLWNIGIKNLTILPSRDSTANSSELITSQRMRNLFSALSAHAPDSIVLFDLPPILTADDVVAVAPMVDAVLLVVSESETTRDDLSNALDLLGTMNIIGITLNKSAR